MTFEYHAATDPDPEVRRAFSRCFFSAAGSHMHLSWRGFARANLYAQGAALWSRTFDDVPVGVELQVQVSAGNTCSDTNPTGAVTANVFANGVRLVRIVDTPGTAVEPGLAFTLVPDGTVMP